MEVDIDNTSELTSSMYNDDLNWLLDNPIPNPYL